MKIAVTGANGFVGRAVLANLAARGVAARPLVRRPSGLPNECIVGDLADGSLDVAHLGDVNAIIHLAARTHVMNDDASDPMAEYRKTNVEGTRKLIETAISAKVGRIVFMSSVKAVGEYSLPGQPLGPDSEPRPEDAYGQSKLEAERLLQTLCDEAGMAWTVLRPPLVHGAGAKGNLARLAGLIRRGIPLPLGAIQNVRSIVSVENLADAAVTAALQGHSDGEILHIADLSLSTPQLARIIGQAEGRPARLFPVPPSLLKLAGKVTGTSAEVGRLTGSLELETLSSFRALHWQPPVDGTRALERTLNEA